LFAKETLDQLNARAPLGDVLFDYDAATVREDQRGTLQKNADFMRRWLTTRISVEGHADSRGTNEYNLALGDRRAKAAMNYLVAQGISADRMTIVSYGEERPVCTEKNEACWAKNRRDQFMVKER
jgi:peptidoglycan-associated lipoprotein